ncbi:MAG: CHAT domain-containing protein, partial [Chloroflexi bacterium]
EGTILFEDPSGGTDSMSATQLARLLADHPTMRLVVMNSCEGARGGKEDIFSSTASILVRRGIPAVLAMQYEISDKAAIAFSTHFYKALAEGSPVDAAVSGARISMSLLMDDTLEWATPVLYMRSQDGVLFRIDPSVKVLPPKKQEESVVPSLAERKRIEWEKAQSGRQREAERQPVQPPGTAEIPGKRVSTPPLQPQSRTPPRTTEPARPQQAPQQASKPGFFSGKNKFIVFGAGGLALLFLCGCLVFILSQIIPVPTPVTPVVRDTDIPEALTPVLPVVTITREPTWTPPPEPFTPTWTPSPQPEPALGYADVVKNYWDFYGDRNFEKSWVLLSDRFREKNYSSDFNKYLADKTEQYCDVGVTRWRVLTETRSNVYILAVVNFKKGASCEDSASYLVHQVTLSGSSWLIDRVIAGVTSDSKCDRAARRLSVGATARVATRAEPLMVRAFPSAAESEYLFDRLLPGTDVPVLDGPVCAKYNDTFYWWWKVRSPAGVEGWVVEGSDDTDPAFIKPVQ